MSAAPEMLGLPDLFAHLYRLLAPVGLVTLLPGLGGKAWGISLLAQRRTRIIEVEVDAVIPADAE